MVTQPTLAPAPVRRRRKKGGSGGARAYTARALTADYLDLCRDPTRDIQRWIEEDRKDRGRRRDDPKATTKTTTKGGKHVHAEKQTDTVARAVRVRGKQLHEVRSRMGPPQQERGVSGNLPARSRSGSAGHGSVRSLRPARNADLGRVARSGFRAAAQATNRRVPSHAIQPGARADWPDQMKRDLRACRTPDDHRAWQEKWASILGGLVRETPSEQPARPIAAAAQRPAARHWS